MRAKLLSLAGPCSHLRQLGQQSRLPRQLLPLLLGGTDTSCCYFRLQLLHLPDLLVERLHLRVVINALHHKRREIRASMYVRVYPNQRFGAAKANGRESACPRLAEKKKFVGGDE